MKDLPIKVEVMAKDIQYLKEEVGEIKQLIKDHTETEAKVWGQITDQMNALLDRKADRWVEKVLVVVGSAVGLAVIGALMELILRK